MPGPPQTSADPGALRLPSISDPFSIPLKLDAVKSLNSGSPHPSLTDPKTPSKPRTNLPPTPPRLAGGPPFPPRTPA